MKTIAEQIRAIDRKIDRIHKKLQQLETIRPLSSASWQKAWDKHPDLHAREIALYRERGELQVKS